MASPTPPLGDYLKQIRLAKNWSQRQAAEAVGVAHSRIGEVERGIDGRTGKAFSPSYTLLLRIAKGYQLDPHDLLVRGGYDPGWLELTDDEWHLVAVYRKLSRDEQEAFISRLCSAPEAP